jgi:hypothetical protein
MFDHPDRMAERLEGQAQEQLDREAHRELIARHAPANNDAGEGEEAGAGHTPVVLRKQGSAYRTDEGEEVPEHTLHRYECSCGWRGACWYAGLERAAASFGRHLYGVA